MTIIKQKKKQELSYYEDKFQLKSQFNESPTKFGFQLNCTWVNVYKNESKSSVTEAYWSNFHKLIYIAFKLPNTLPTYNKKLLMSLVI